MPESTLDILMGQIALRNRGARYEAVAGIKTVAFPCRVCGEKTPNQRWHTVDQHGDLDAWFRCTECCSIRQRPLPSSSETLANIERMQRAA